MIDLRAILGRAATVDWWLEKPARTGARIAMARSASQADVPALCDEVERLRDTVQDYRDDIRKTLDDRGADDEVHCSCVPALRGEIARLRAQLDAVMEAVDAEQEDIPHFGAAIRFAKSSIKTRIAALVGKS